MAKWIEDNEYYTKKYETHESMPSKVIISIRKDTISIKQYDSISHGYQKNESGA